MLPERNTKSAQTGWVATGVFAPKECGFLQLGVKYCKLDAVTKHDVYPTPRIDKRIDFLGKVANL